MSEKKESSSSWSSGLESLVSFLGGIAWIIGVINGAIYLFWGIYSLIILGYFGFLFGWSIWLIIAGIITLALSIIFVRPRFSNPCKNKEWDTLYEDYLTLGNFHLPWMLIWGILLEIFGQWWGGITILLPALILLFAGPRTYQWTS
ncbi:MAG: hypothetical protein ACTSU4_01335 [Promethearchaeota archaeon]